MTVSAPDEKQELLQELNKGREALGAVLAGVDEQLAARRPAPGRWSVLECVEHLAVAEQLMLSRLESAARSQDAPENREREWRILSRGANRTRPMEAPEPARPAGRFRSLAEALSAFDSVRGETVQFVERSGEFRMWMTAHPVIGPVNCHEMLLIMAIHPARHAKQIEEIRGALGQ